MRNANTDPDPDADLESVAYAISDLLALANPYTDVIIDSGRRIVVEPDANPDAHAHNHADPYA